MKQSPSWEPANRSASHEIPYLLRSLKIHYRNTGYNPEPLESNLKPHTIFP